jgi:hypothetical protein
MTRVFERAAVNDGANAEAVAKSAIRRRARVCIVTKFFRGNAS